MDNSIDTNNLTAKDGHAFIRIDHSAYSKSVFLGKNDSQSNWIEMPEKEAISLYVEYEQRELLNTQAL